jgi:hypothetical protein
MPAEATWTRVRKDFHQVARGDRICMILNMHKGNTTCFIELQSPIAD